MFVHVDDEFNASKPSDYPKITTTSRPHETTWLEEPAVNPDGVEERREQYADKIKKKSEKKVKIELLIQMYDKGLLNEGPLVKALTELV